MEEKKNAQGNSPQKMSYEDLARTANELSIQNKKMVEYIQQLQAALAEQDFNRISFFLSMLFKVMDHAEYYSDDFIKWAIEKIESSLKEFDAELNAEPQQNEAK